MMRALLSRGLVSIALGLCTLAAQPQARVEPARSRPDVPNVTLRDGNGHPVSLSAYKGRVVMLDFWETWCGGCEVEVPWYIGDITAIIHAFDLVSLPRTLLIDRHGRIADAHTGIVDRAAWEQEIKALLREK
jgi:cytochrome c biogenesis protein CcmG/thiol:disulfide interchange protein DsbE